LPTPRIDTPRSSSEEAAGILLIRVAILVALLGGLARTWADPDLWGHVRFGADILRTGLGSADPYSFTSDVPWVNHEWLAEVLMYAAWYTSGNAGLVLLKLGVICGTVAFVLHILRLDRVASPTGDLLAFVVLVGLWPRVFVVRPQLFSVVLFASLMWILRTTERGQTWRLWLPPGLMALWVNLHGGWLVGLGALLIWIAGSFPTLGGALIPRRSLVICAVVTLAATLVNPYGLGLWAFLSHTVRLNRPNINDWRPLYESGADVILPWILTAAAAAAGLWRARFRVPPTHALIVVGLGIASVRVSRLDVFFTLSTVMLLAPCFAEPRAVPPSRPRWTTRTGGIAAALALAIIAVGWTARTQLSCVKLDGPWMPEREAGATILMSRLEGRLLTWFDWGQYAIWHFSPGLKVSLDGRRETVYSDAFVARHLQLYFQPEAENDLLRVLRPDYAWLPIDIPLANALDKAGWHRLFSGPRSVVFSREITPPPSAPVLSSACFPGP
jgi:hypothetical protein